MQKIAFRYGLWMFLGFTGFFLIMHLFQLSGNYYLRVFNGVIHLSLLWMALREWSRDHYESANYYSSGVMLGMATSIIGIVPFSIFMSIFLAYNPDFLAQIKSETPIGEYFNPFTSSLFILVEGIAISLIASYIIVRILETMREKA